MHFVKLMQIRHNVKRTNNRSSVAKHYSKLLPTKQMSSTIDRRRNTGTAVDSSGSSVENMFLAKSFTKSCNRSDSSSDR